MLRFLLDVASLAFSVTFALSSMWLVVVFLINFYASQSKGDYPQAFLFLTAVSFTSSIIMAIVIRIRDKI